MLKYNPDTKVIFDNDEAAVAPVREITRDEIPDLIANGAGVDASANVGEQTSPAGQTAGDALAAQDPAVPVIGSDTAGEQGNVFSETATAASASGISSPANAFDSTESANQATGSSGSSSSQSPMAPTGTDEGNADAAVTGSPSVTAAADASFASSVDTQPAAVASSTSASTESTADAAVDAPEPVVTNAQADPGGAGSADLSPTPAAPNLDAQEQGSAIPLIAGARSAPSAAEIAEEHPLTIIGEIEALVLLIGNSAVHEYHRLLQRLADLKNHPQVKSVNDDRAVD